MPITLPSPIRRAAAFVRLMKMPRRFRLAAVLAVSFGAVVMLATGSVMVVEWLLARQITVEFLNESVKASMEELERGVHARLDATHDLVDDLAQMYIDGTLTMGDLPDQRMALAAAFAGRPDLSTIVAIDPQRRMLSAARRGDGSIGFRTQQIGETEESAARLAGMRERRTAFWGDIIYVDEVRQPVINVRRAVFRRDELLGYVGAGITISQFSLLVDWLAAEGFETPFILYGQDRVLAHPHLAEAGEEAWVLRTLPGLGQINDPVVAQLAAGREIAQFDRSKRFGLQVRWVEDGRGGAIAATKELTSYGDVAWTLGLWVPGSLLTATLAPLRHGAFLGGALLLLALGTAYLLGRLLAWPIQAATEGAASVSTLALEQVKPLTRSRIKELDEQATAFNAMLSTIRAFQTYVPRSLVQQLISHGGVEAIRSAQRDLTVMFTDVVGFTHEAERLPASDIAAFLNDHFALLARCVEAEGGTVDKFVGDGLMAFWGAPERLKDRAARACRAALAIDAALRLDNAHRAAKGWPTVRLRIGIHRGPLLVGNIGSPGRINYTVVGDVANVAQRLEQLGREVMVQGDQTVVLVSAAVVEHAGAGFSFEPWGEMSVHGRDEPVRVFRLLGLAPADAPTTPTAAPALAGA